MAAPFVHPMPQLSRYEDLDDQDKSWFYHQTLRCIRQTNPDTVEADLDEPNGKYHPHVTFWMTKVFEGGNWNSNIAPSVNATFEPIFTFNFLLLTALANRFQPRPRKTASKDV